ncbi:MAG: twin-arginine translocase subunit TatC [Paludibacteraceae bacterium]|nr:twin-arginine translocase subunit TatC [Paludibacteraceae bacterium]
MTGEPLTFGGHLDVLRRMLMRIAAVTVALAAVVFCFKDATFGLLLAPTQWDFITYRMLERLMNRLGFDFGFEPYHVNLIATELSSQFMAHLTASLMLGALLASPYIVVELFAFVAPALYDRERKVALRVMAAVCALFALGVLMSYFVLVPIAFRFLGTYQVAPQIESNITLDSYIRTFTTLTLLMGLVFQLPVAVGLLARRGIVRSDMMRRYRRHAILLIMLLAAVITPPDVMTLLLVALPLALLYELSIRIARHVEEKAKQKLKEQKRKR